MIEIALTAFATFFVTVMPFKAAPFFAGLTDGWPEPRRRAAAVSAVVVSTIVLLAVGTRWFVPHPTRVAWLPVVVFVVWFPTIYLGTSVLGWR